MAYYIDKADMGVYFTTKNSSIGQNNFYVLCNIRTVLRFGAVDVNEWTFCGSTIPFLLPKKIQITNIVFRSGLSWGESNFSFDGIYPAGFKEILSVTCSNSNIPYDYKLSTADPVNQSRFHPKIHRDNIVYSTGGGLVNADIIPFYNENILCDYTFKSSSANSYVNINIENSAFNGSDVSTVVTYYDNKYGIATNKYILCTKSVMVMGKIVQ